MNVVLVFPASECTIESWSITKAERKNIDSFEMICWRCILRISSCVITRHISVLLNDVTMSVRRYDNQAHTIIVRIH